MNTDIQYKYFECACSSDEHMFRFAYFKNEDGTLDVEDGIYLSVQLPKQRFWSRLRAGVKYILGYQCEYGHWDTTVLLIDDVKKLRDFLNLTIHGGNNNA